MLESPKAQAVYRALQSSSGFNSSAGNKAAAAISKSTDIYSQLESLKTLPKEGIPPAGGLPVIIPKEIKDAAAKLERHQALIGTTTSVSQGLSGAIDLRMENLTGNMAMMNAASAVAQKMGDVPGGCGPVGAAFSVLTSEGRTDALNALLDGLGGPLGELASIFEEALGLNSSSLPEPLRAALAAAMSACDGLMSKVDAATKGIDSLVGEAQSMWNKLNSVFAGAVQASILTSMINSPCMMAVIDSVAPPEVSDILNAE